MKHRLRVAALLRRDALSAELRRYASSALLNHLAEVFPVSEVIAAYWPIGSEIDSRLLIKFFLSRGNQLVLPALSADNEMVFRLFTKGEALVKMPFGFQGPPASAPILHPTSILLPVVAFDDSGNRLGYGKGYYDRTIAKMRIGGFYPRLIGLAFECQRFQTIPADCYDVSLQAIVTENGLHYFHKSNC